MSLSSACLLELKIHRDLLSALNAHVNVEAVIPEEIRTVVSDIACVASLASLPIPVACGSYVEEEYLVLPIFVGCSPSDFADLGGLEGIAIAVQLHFKMYFYEILQESGQQHLATNCIVRVGCDCLSS